MQAMYPGTMNKQLAHPRYDWGLLVVLLAIEMDKKNWLKLCTKTEPKKMVRELVLQKCCSEHQGLQALFNDLMVGAGWGEEYARVCAASC